MSNHSSHSGDVDVGSSTNGFAIPSTYAPSSFEFWCCFGGAVTCLVLSGLASGVNIGLMSLSPLSLQLLVDTAPSEIRRDPLLRLQARRALKVLPLVSRKHVVLVTLLLTTAIADEVLPLCIDAIAPTWVAVVVSVATMLLFTEVIPTAVFTDHRNSLKLAAGLAPFVWCLIGLLGVMTYPMAKAVEMVVEKTHKKVGDADSAAGSCDAREAADGVEGQAKAAADPSTVEARQLLRLPRLRALIKVLRKELSRYPSSVATQLSSCHGVEAPHLADAAPQPANGAPTSYVSTVQLSVVERALDLTRVAMLDVMDPIGNRTLRLQEFAAEMEPGMWQAQFYRVLCRKGWAWFVVEGLRGAGSWDAFDVAAVMPCLGHATSLMGALLDSIQPGHSASLLIVEGSSPLLDVEEMRMHQCPQDSVVLVRGRQAGVEVPVVIGVCHVPQALRERLVPHEGHQRDSKLPRHGATQSVGRKDHERQQWRAGGRRGSGTHLANSPSTGMGYTAHDHDDCDSEEEDIAALLNGPRVANAVPWSMKYASSNW